MITTGASPLDIRFEVVVNGMYLDYASVKRVNIELQENMHNLAVLEVGGIPPHNLTDFIDLPISIKVSIGQIRMYGFVGYITYLEPESINKNGLIDKSPFQLTRIHCLGASYPMRSRKTKVWNNRTLSQIATEIAKDYSLTVSVPNDPYVFPRLVQSGKSDWELLTSAANYLGYQVLVRGVHIDIWDPFAVFSRSGSVPLYAMSGNKGRLNASPGQVIKFHGVIGAVTPLSARTNETVHSLVGNQIVTTSLSTSTGYGETVESIFQDEVGANAQSVEMATALLQGRSRNKLPYIAHVDVVGDPVIQPGMAVSIDRYDSGLDGLWIVQAVRHEVSRGMAMSYLTLAKDSNDIDSINSTVKAALMPELTEPVLKNNRWMTGTEMIHVYA